MIISFSLLVLGLIFLTFGADYFVNGASTLARKYNVSQLAIGLTVVAFGTSAPELVVNVIASYNSHPNIVFGNIIGSNNFNLFVILGIAGLISPLVVKSSTVWKEIPFSLGAALLLAILANNFLGGGDAELSRLDGCLLLVLFVGFLIYVKSQIGSEMVAEGESTEPMLSNVKIGLYLLFGLLGLMVGGNFVVDNAVNIAQEFGLSEQLIGLTIVAAGTSLPELATSVVAAMKKNNDIAIGNIVGSNIFNIFLILGVSSLVRPISYDPAFNMDIIVLCVGTLFLFIAMFTSGKRKLDRWEAGLLLVAFLGYMSYKVITLIG